MVQSFLIIDHWRIFPKITTEAESKWFIAKAVTKKLMRERSRSLSFAAAIIVALGNSVNVSFYMWSSCLETGLLELAEELLEDLLRAIDDPGYAKEPDGKIFVNLKKQ